MDLFDLLDRENDRLVADFDDCLSMPDSDALWGTAAQALLGRMATYSLVVEQVLQPGLLALDFKSLDALCRTHERLRRVVAEALLSARGPRPVAEKALRATRQVLTRYRYRLRRDFYPPLFALLSTAEALMLSDDMLQWMDRHCRQMQSWTPLRGRRDVDTALRQGAKQHRPTVDAAHIPTLHHAIPRDQVIGARLL